MTGKILPAIFLMIFCVAVISAQVSPEKQIINAREEFFGLRTRSLELGRVKREAAKPLVTDNSTINFPAIKEDFERIQKLNEEVFKLTANKSPINYAFILKSVTEISHRSARLKSNLFQTDPTEQKEVKDNQPTEMSQSLKKHLEKLDKSVINFAHNSIFQNINLVNSQDSLKAQNDLETIIKASFAIQEEAKKLTKSVVKK